MASGAEVEDRMKGERREPRGGDARSDHTLRTVSGGGEMIDSYHNYNQLTVCT